MKSLLRISFIFSIIVAISSGQRRYRQENKKTADPGVLAPKTAGQESAIDVTKAVDLNCDGEIHFELITGYVYSSAEDIIDSKHRTLKVTECIDSCRSNAQCRAVNFETGLCILFKTAAGENSASLAVSQLPVFTLYAQKVCLPASAPRCTTPWAYETTPGLSIIQGYARSDVSVSSRSECALKCLTSTEFRCSSASYNPETGSCVLAEFDRNMAGRRQYLRMAQSTDLIKVSCVKEEQKLCEFQPIKGKILKTVDTVYQDVESFEGCKQRCLTEEFECHSYDFMSAGTKICRLSHHSSASLSHIQEPYIEVENTTTFELRGCYKINVECRGNGMTAKIQTSSLFDGKVYVKSRPNTCVSDVQNTTKIELNLPYNDVKCDVVQEEDGLFTSNIVIQHHDMIVTSADVGLALHCKYSLENQTVTNSLLSGGLEVKEAIETEYIKEYVHSPNVTMRITDINGDEILAAQVGDELALRFEILDPHSPYEIFVRELVAMDGQDSSEIILIDAYGCPTDQSILQAVEQVGNGMVLQAPFHAFKFPLSDVVQFRALVTPCLPKCEVVTCGQEMGIDGLRSVSYGRKKRSIDEPSLLVAKSVKITDKFTFEESMFKDDVQKKITDVDVTCVSFAAVIICGVLFLVSQVVVLMVWSFLWHKKRATKQIPSVAGSVPAEVLYGSLSSRQTSTSYLTD